MNYQTFLFESRLIIMMIRRIMNTIPDIIIEILFTAVAFSIVIGIVNMLRGIRS